MPGRGRLALVAMWLLGLASLASVLVLQGRVDQRRQAQLAVASLRLQVGALPRTALGLNGRQARATVQAELDSAERQIALTAGRLDGLSGNRTDSRLIMREADALFPLLARTNAVASAGHLRTATVGLGLALLPGAPGYRLNETFDAIGAKYDRQAASARRLAGIGSAIAIALLLLAFSFVLWRASRLAREKHELLEQSRHDAVTDQLTGLWNRRQLFSDLEELLASPGAGEPAVLGVLDLDGFKAYNDRFGHPAGDALLARVAQTLRRAVENWGAAYRIGGDEFCVIAHGAGADALVQSACATLGERADGITITCSLGTTPIAADGSTTDQVLHRADQRLYNHKRSSRATAPAGSHHDDRRPVFAA